MALSQILFFVQTFVLLISRIKTTEFNSRKKYSKLKTEFLFKIKDLSFGSGIKINSNQFFCEVNQTLNFKRFEIR
jgi:hypothetical protein